MAFYKEKDLLKKYLTSKEFELCEKIAEGDEDVLSHQDLHDKLYELYSSGSLRGDMPIGTMNADTQTPDEWLLDRLTKVFRD